jgi:hypothetical protein
MSDIPLNSTGIGANVWRTWNNLTAKSTGLGQIVAFERLSPGMDHFLYTVNWENGEQSKQFFRDLFCIGPFSTAQDFLNAITNSSDLTLTLGPKGGFRSFRCTVLHLGEPRQIRISSEHGRLFRDVIDPYLKKSKAPYVTNVLEAQKPLPRIDIDEFYGIKKSGKKRNA